MSCCDKKEEVPKEIIESAKEELNQAIKSSVKSIYTSAEVIVKLGGQEVFTTATGKPLELVLSSEFHPLIKKALEDALAFMSNKKRFNSSVKTLSWLDKVKRFFKGKDPEPGEVWLYVYEQNPFFPTYVSILEVKEGWVKFRYLKDSSIGFKVLSNFKSTYCFESSTRYV